MLLLSSCKTMVRDFEVCETDPVYNNGICFYVFSKQEQRIPKAIWNKMQKDMVSMKREQYFLLLRDLRNVCFQRNIKCEALEGM